MVAKSALKRTNPSALSCFLSVVSLAVVLAGLHVLDLLMTVEHHVELKETLNQSIQSAQDLRTLAQDPVLEYVSDEVRSEYIRLAGIHALLGEGQSQRALEQLQSHVSSKRLAKTVLEAKLQKHIKHENSLRSMQSQLLAEQSKQKRLLRNFENVRQRTETLLHFMRPENIPEEESVEAIVVYENGVLAGLPELPGLPSVERVQNILPHISPDRRREIASQLASPASDLQQTFTQIRGEMARMQSEFQEAKVIAETRTSEADELMREHTDSYKDLLKLTRILATETIEPSLDPWTQVVHEKTETTLARYGFTLISSSRFLQRLTS